MSAPFLSVMIVAPALGAAALLVLTALGLPADRRDRWARGLALLGSGLPLAAALGMWATFDPAAAGPQHVDRATWIASIGAEYFVGVDGLNVALVILSGVLGFVATAASLTTADRAPAWFALLLLLQTAASGAFAALDGFLFFVFLELSLVPLYFLIGLWGGPKKEHAATKLILFLLVGSAFLLLAIVAIHWQTGSPRLFEHADAAGLQRLTQAGVVTQGPDGALGYTLGDGTFARRTFDLTRWRALGRIGFFAFAGEFLFDAPFATVIFAFVFLGFAVKVPLVPLHTWQPDAHVEAPTAVSVLLAGLLSKVGLYGLIRIGLAVVPETARAFAPGVAWLGAAAAIIGATVGLAQRDLRRLIAYGSMAQLGFSVLGIAAAAPPALSGAVFNLVSHGLIWTLVFLCAGALVDRTRHRELDGFGGLASVRPELAGLTGLAFFAAVGVPGLAGFAPELLVLTGAFAGFAWPSALCAMGAVIAAGAWVWAFQRVFLGKRDDRWAGLTALTVRERLLLYPLAAAVVGLGLAPGVLLKLIDPGIARWVGP